MRSACEGDEARSDSDLLKEALAGGSKLGWVDWPLY
jgi:hypothetical protein